MIHARGLWLALALVAATAIAYQPAWNGGLVWDDDRHVTAPALRSIEGLARIWFEVGATQQYYPLAHSAFWIQQELWGDHTLGYHLLNIVLHGLSAFLLLCILQRLAVPGALIAGVLFALHPVHVESVAWITELKNTLSGALYFAAALVYLRFDDHRRPRHYVTATAVFILALLTKTVTATLPAALLVVFWWKRGTLRWREDVLPLVPWLAIGAASGLFTAWVERTYIGAMGADFALPFLERILLAARALGFYAAALAWPADLIFIYPKWTITRDDATLYLYLGAAIAAITVAWLGRRRTRTPLTVMLLFGGTLFPALGFFNVYPFRFSYVADHFAYLASAAPFALVGAGLAQWIAARSRRPLSAQGAVAVVLAVPLGVLTWQQSHHYINAETLYLETLERNPSCWMCHNNLASLKLAEGDGRLDESLAHIDASLRLQPRNPEALNNRAVVLQKLGRLDEALDTFDASLSQSTSADVLMNHGVALQAAGRMQEALVRFETIIRLKPEAADAHEHAAAVLLALNEPAAAVTHLEQALRVQPDFPGAHDKLGTALARLGRLDEALVHFEAARRSAPDDPEVRNNLGSALARAGRIEQALAEYQESLRLRPDAASVHDNLGYLLLRSGRRAEALTHFETAVRLDANYAPARLNLGNMLVDAGRPAEAIPHFQRALQRAGSDVDLAQLHSNLGVAYAMTGQRTMAIREFEEALRIRPDFDQARANLARARGGSE
jgi:protein O-mannosyl-transferase